MRERERVKEKKQRKQWKKQDREKRRLEWTGTKSKRREEGVKERALERGRDKTQRKQ